MSCPKESIELRRDMLNLIETHPNMPASKMRLIHSKEHTRRILRDFEKLGLIELEETGQTYKKTLTDKGKKYQKAFNYFSDFLDAC